MNKESRNVREAKRILRELADDEKIELELDYFETHYDIRIVDREFQRKRSEILQRKKNFRTDKKIYGIKKALKLLWDSGKVLGITCKLEKHTGDTS